MKIYSIQSAQFYGDDACVIHSTAKDPRLSKVGIDVNHQIKTSDILFIKQTGNSGWARISPEDASPAQRVIATTVFTTGGIGMGVLIGGLLGGPVGAAIGGPLGGSMGIKQGLNFGGVGRLAPVLISSNDEKTIYVGSLPLWQVKKIERILESASGRIEFREAEVK